MLGSNFEHHYRIKTMKQILLNLRSHKEEEIVPESEIEKICKKYLSLRKEFQISNLETVINICRIIMLVRKLKLPGYTYVTKILYSAMGLFSTFLAVVKMVFDQPVVVEFWGKEENSKAEIKTKATLDVAHTI